MGTNFYWSPPQAHLGNDALTAMGHIGKRGAAGLFCWDCDCTLCKGGNDAIHQGPRLPRKPDGTSDWSNYIALSKEGWFTTCPQCGQTEQPDSYNTALVELGFAELPVARPKGVQSCSSFAWAQQPEVVGTLCRKHPETILVVDEYDKPYTGQQFLDILTLCPVQFTDMIGREFS